MAHSSISARATTLARKALSSIDSSPITKVLTADNLTAPRIPLGLSKPFNAIDLGTKVIYEFTQLPLNLSRGGCPAVGSADLQLLFWGDFWNTAVNPSTGDITAAVTAILASPYLSELEQYGFNSLTMRKPLVVVDPGPPGGVYSGDDAKNMVWALIDDGHFPEPDEDGGAIIYMIFAPKGSDFEAGEAGGAHRDGIDTDIFYRDHAPVAWVNYSSNLNEITSYFSHELVETISDPQPSEGWTFDGQTLNLSEIADWNFGFGLWMAGGAVVQAYYSARLGTTVVPSTKINRSVSLTAAVSAVGREQFLGSGEITLKQDTSCFKGTYGWKLFGQGSRVTITAHVDTYISPDVKWTVNGVAASVFGSPQKVSVPAEANSDPLYIIATQPPENSTVSFIVDANNALVLEIAAGQPPAQVTVSCTVEDTALPLGFQVPRNAIQGSFLTGRRREMDARWASDLYKCLEAKLKIAKLKLKLIDAPVQIGDPDPPQWGKKDLGFLAANVSQPIREALFLAHILERSDSGLAHDVRAAAQAKLAQLRNQPLEAGR